MNSHLIRGVSPRTPLNFFHWTVTCQSSCIFCLFAFTFKKYFLSFVFTFKKKTMVAAPSSRYLLLRGIGRKKTSLLYVKVFLLVVFSLTSEFFFAPARMRLREFYFSRSFFRTPNSALLLCHRVCVRVFF
jgi:hypothetical protein